MELKFLSTSRAERRVDWLAKDKISLCTSGGSDGILKGLRLRGFRGLLAVLGAALGGMTRCSLKSERQNKLKGLGRYVKKAGVLAWCW